MSIDPDDLRCIVIRTPNGFDEEVELSEREALNLAAFCNVTGLRPEAVVQRALEAFFRAHPGNFRN